MMNKCGFLFFAHAMLAVAFAGCGGPTVVSVKGIAIFQGKPVPHVIVYFAPGEGRPSSGLTDENGRFELEFNPKLKGAVVGTHKVRVSVAPKDSAEEAQMANGQPPRDPIRAAIAEKYGKPDATPLSVTITRPEANLELRLD